MLKRSLTLIILMLMLVACNGGPVTPANPTAQAATAEANIANTRAASTPAATPTAQAGTPITPAETTPAGPTPESRGDRIAFWRDTDGVVDIFVIDPDTGEEINLTKSPLYHEFRPVWSPDGSLIAYVSDERDNWDIFFRPVDPTGPVLPSALTISMNPDIFPRWSPDGELVTYHTFSAGQFDVMRVEVATNVKANLTIDTPDSSETQPVWRPDGAEILFISDRDGQQDDLFVMTHDGWNVRQLTKTLDAAEWDAEWSPDSAWIAFVSDRDGNAEIYLMRADGSDLRRITQNEVADGIPVFSPDGRLLLLVSKRDGNEEIYLLDLACLDTAEGCDGEAINLTNHSGSDSLPAWSPDGTRIAFVSDRDGVENLFLMQADGSNQINLTESSGQEFGPIWAPRPDLAQP